MPLILYYSSHEYKFISIEESLNIFPAKLRMSVMYIVNVCQKLILERSRRSKKEGQLRKLDLELRHTIFILSDINCFALQIHDAPLHVHYMTK